MDWSAIVEHNRGRLLAVLAPLFAVFGFDPGRAALPRHLYRALLITLRPAESAMRRLIIMAARGLVVTLGASRAFPKGLSPGKNLERVPAFGLIDPLKRFAPGDFEWARQGGRIQVMPRISVPGIIDPVFAERVIPMTDEPIDCAALQRRLRVLQRALDNLPREALRLARWKARGERARQSQAAPKPARLSPFRPGFAPGHRRHKPREIDAILSDCHYFAREAWHQPDSS